MNDLYFTDKNKKGLQITYLSFEKEKVKKQYKGMAVLVIPLFVSSKKTNKVILYLIFY